MTYHFDHIIDRTDTFSMKWDKYKGKDIIPMWVADMDFKAPPAVLKALQQRIEHGILGYTATPGPLNDMLIKRLSTLYDWKIEKEWIVWIPGVVCGLNAACSAIGKPHGKILTTTPIYPPFLNAPGNCGKKLVTTPMIERNKRSTLDFEAIENAFKKDVDMFMFCTPYNPCGTVFTKSEITRLIGLCNEHDVVICSDEIHSDFVLDKNKRHIPTASVSQKAARMTLTLMAPSKTYNIPGLGCSFAIIPDQKLKKTYQKTLKGLIPQVNLLGFIAAQAAYEKCDDWLDELIIYLRKNRDIVFNRVNKMKGCRLNPVESTYLAWIDVRGTGLDNPVDFFEQAGVGLFDGVFFGQKGFVRLNFGCPRPLLEKGLDRMAAALDTL